MPQRLPLRPKQDNSGTTESREGFISKSNNLPVTLDYPGMFLILVASSLTIVAINDVSSAKAWPVALLVTGAFFWILLFVYEWLLSRYMKANYKTQVRPLIPWEMLDRVQVAVFL